MALDGINGVPQNPIKQTGVKNEQNSTQSKIIIKFADHSSNNNNVEPSDGKIQTEMFKDEIMSMLDTSKSKMTPQNIKFYLGKLLETIQTLNGAKKNNLKPQGNTEQNKLYEVRLQEAVHQMENYAKFVGSGLSVVQDSKAGLYKLSINDKLLDVPERNVKIATIETEDGQELMPEIVD